jgi:tRNA threonylcarbamoyladenosine biosynthesis protein TsaE
MDLSIRTESAKQTECLGQVLAAYLRPGMVLTLEGDLAAGKTCLVRGMATGLGSRHAVCSPTFTLVNEYAAAKPDAPIGRLYHVDLYRLSGPEELFALGYEDIFDPSDAASAIEWPERAGSALPDQRVRICLEHAGMDVRQITISDNALFAPGWDTALQNALEECIIPDAGEPETL